MGKAGGDATWRFFHCVSDLVECAHPTEDPRKHELFSDRSDLEGKRLFLDLRRLPSLVLSYDHGPLSFFTPEQSDLASAGAVEER